MMNYFFEIVLEACLLLSQVFLYGLSHCTYFQTATPALVFATRKSEFATLSLPLTQPQQVCSAEWAKQMASLNLLCFFYFEAQLVTLLP